MSTALRLTRRAARRAALYADESGRTGWTPVASLLVGELRDLLGALGAAMPALAGEKPPSAVFAHHHYI
jgi:hypothetical protein